MISYNFDYFQAKSFEEAISVYTKMEKQAKKPFYIAGGTELLTLGRTNQIVTDVVIDLKSIPECNMFTTDQSSLTIGAGLILNKIQNKQSFPLLDQVISEIADHTSRNKITLGGNLCAKIIYQEALLPFLLTDSIAIIATAEGIIEKPIHELLNEGNKLRKGDILLSLKVRREATKLPYFTVKKRRQWRAGYPLLTIAAIEQNNKIRLAFSGLTKFAFRSFKLEEILNDQTLNLEERVNHAVTNLPFQILEDVHGSAAYREFVLKNCLLDILALWKEGMNCE